jgi:rod shape-determining protein MreC
LAEEGTVRWLPAVRRPSARRAFAVFLILTSAILIILGKVDQVIFESFRTALTDDAAPILDALSRPLMAVENVADDARSIINTYQENVRLAETNRKLLRWQRAALTLASENAQLRSLLKLVPDPAVSYVTARVIAVSGGPFLRNLMIDAGSEAGIVRGQAAVTGEGLVGRVYDVGRHAARVLLITDPTSRVPVLVERSGQRAILSGESSGHPSLWYLDPAAPLKMGDRIVTSGEGGAFPRGLPVGTVDEVDREPPRIEPYVQLAEIEYVRIVDYGLADGLPVPMTTASTGGQRIDRTTAHRASCR